MGLRLCFFSDLNLGLESSLHAKRLTKRPLRALAITMSVMIFLEEIIGQPFDSREQRMRLLDAISFIDALASQPRPNREVNAYQLARA